MPTTVTAVTAVSPRRLPLAAALPLIGILLCAAFLYGKSLGMGEILSPSPTATAMPGTADEREENLQLHLLVGRWRDRARAGHGEVTITSDELQRFALLANDACRP